jgi:hypothetical protein
MMRAVALIVAVTTAGCSGSPSSYGITGPSQPAAAPMPDDSTIRQPGIPDPGSSYGPSIGPIPSTGRYFNYN